PADGRRVVQGPGAVGRNALHAAIVPPGAGGHGGPEFAGCAALLRTVPECRAETVRSKAAHPTRETYASRSTPSPSRSTSGARPPIRSATARALPQDSAQPLEPWPMLIHTPGTPVAPSSGGPSGSIGRAPFHSCTPE